MKTLYKKFLHKHIHANISFTNFTRCRPFWVLKQTNVQRDTCLCRKHENIEFKAKKLKLIHLLSDDNHHNLYEYKTCDKKSESSCIASVLNAKIT